MQNKTNRTVLTALSGTLLTLAAAAAFTNASVPAFRGTAEAETAEWEIFQNAVGAPNPPTGPLTTAGNDATLEQFTPGAFLTGPGNLYSPAGALSVAITGTVAGDLQEVWLQTQTFGAELDYPAVRLDYVDAGGATVSLPPAQTTELARFPSTGVHVETLFEWRLEGVPEDLRAYTLRFDGAGAHVSLDSVQLDTRVGVAPSTYCQAKVNSRGCLPTIASSGTPVAGASAGFVVRASQVRNQKPGLLFYSVTGRAQLPFQGAFLCVASPIRRTPATHAGGNPLPADDCSGVYSIDMSAFASGTLGGNPLPSLNLPGTVVDAQWWGRDQGFPAPMNTTLSDGLEFTVQS